MSLVYKCNFYGTTTNNENQYPHKRVLVIPGSYKINGVDVQLKLALEIVIPAAGGERIHASVPAWKDAAQILKDWLDATFP